MNVLNIVFEIIACIALTISMISAIFCGLVYKSVNHTFYKVEFAITTLYKYLRDKDKKSSKADLYEEFRNPNGLFGGRRI